MYSSLLQSFRHRPPRRKYPWDGGLADQSHFFTLAAAAAAAADETDLIFGRGHLAAERATEGDRVDRPTDRPPAPVD